MAYGSLRDKLMGTDIRTPGAISQFEHFRNREDQGPMAPNPFAGLQQATTPMANAGATALGGGSLNGAPTTTAAAPSAMSTGAPLGTMAHVGGGGPFTFGFPFGIDEGREEGGGTDAAGGESEAGGESGEGGGGGEGGEGGDGDGEGGEGGEGGDGDGES